MTTALLVLENPWDIPADNPKRASVFPFLQGLEKLLNNFNLYYANFYDDSGFRKALKYDLIHTNEDNQILYAASHGSKYCLAKGTVFVLKSIPKYGAKIKGVIIGCCGIGANINILKSICQYSETSEAYGANWVFAYKHVIDWMPSALIDLSILNEILSFDIPPYQKETILDSFVKALSIFNPYHEIATTIRGVRKTTKETIRLIIRPAGPPTIYDATSELIRRLNWD